MNNRTMKFNVETDKEERCKEVISYVYDALKEKGYEPVNQMIGYLLSGDPTYITTYNDARKVIRRVERDDLLEELLKKYIDSIESI